MGHLNPFISSFHNVFKINLILSLHFRLGLSNNHILQDFLLKFLFHFPSSPFVLYFPPISSSFICCCCDHSHFLLHCQRHHVVLIRQPDTQSTAIMKRSGGAFAAAQRMCVMSCALSQHRTALSTYRLLKFNSQRCPYTSLK